MKRRKWEEHEIEFLKENYNDFSNSEMSIKINRSVSSIEKKLKSLNLKKSSRKLSMKWSDDDIKFLEENYSSMTNQELSNILGRSAKTILNRASKIGLSKSRSHISKVSKDRIVSKDSIVSNVESVISEYMCCECDSGFDSLSGLQIHVTKKHPVLGLEDYYINNINSESNCKYCGNRSKFISFKIGYSDMCNSSECLSKSRASGSYEYHMVNYGNLDLKKEQLSSRLKSLKIGDARRLADNPNYYKEKSHNCKEYWIKRGYSEEESILNSKSVIENIQSISQEVRKNNKEKYLHTYTTRLEYYLNKGMSIEEAEKALANRQTTFSKKICIEKYGEEKGLEWLKRQEKWHSNYKKSNFSKISQELFVSIWEIIKDDIDDIYFATLNGDSIDNSGRNYEYRLMLNESYILPDFYIPNLNKIIEFDGNYYHRDNVENKKREIKRDKSIIDSGIELLHIVESDYRNNKEETIRRCIDFLLEK